MSALFQNAYYLAINFNSILYGTELVIYGMSMNALFNHREKWTRTDKFYIAFSTVLLVLITIYMSTLAVFGQEMWIVHADSPGGPAAFLSENVNVWYQTMGTTASVVLNMLTDALLIYRMYVVWTDYRVIAFPCFLYLATIALGVVELYASGKPNADFFAGTAAQLGISYYTTTIALNTLATAVITGRLVYLGRAPLDVALRIARPHGGITHPHGGTGTSGGTSTGKRVRYAYAYAGTLPIVVESALPYSLAGLAFLVSYGLESDISILFGAFYGMFTCISPQLIVLRVVTGSAWTRDKTAETLSAIEFETLGASGGARAMTTTTTTTMAAASEVGSTVDVDVDGKSMQETV